MPCEYTQNNNKKKKIKHLKIVFIYNKNVKDPISKTNIDD